MFGKLAPLSSAFCFVVFPAKSYHGFMTTPWNQIQHVLQARLSPGHYKVWIAPLNAEIGGEPGEIHLKVFAPTEFMAQRVKARYLETIAQAAAEIFGQKPMVSVEAHTESAPGVPDASPSEAPAAGGRADASQNQMGLPLEYPLPASFESGVERTGLRNAEEAQARYKFDNFIVGPCNELAFAASRSICQDSMAVGTLFLASGPGLGKTHLLRSVGLELSGQCQRSRCLVEYLTAEEFGSRLVAAIKAKNMDSFKARYRNADVLLLEDIHFLRGKERMQEELLSTIKAIRERGGRVVFTSSFIPRDLTDIDEQLASRFGSGFLAQINQPCLETRRRIVRAKAAARSVPLNDEVCELLATHLTRDVRHIESCLHNLILRAQLLNAEITSDLAWDIINHYAEQNPALDIAGIIATVCKAFGITQAQLQSKSRKSDYVAARNSVFYLARKHTDCSLQEIGACLNRAHTTVIKGISALEREINRKSPKGLQMSNTLALIEKNAAAH